MRGFKETLQLTLFAGVFLACLPEITAQSGWSGDNGSAWWDTGSGSGFFASGAYCTDALAMLNASAICSYPVKQQLYFYMIFGNDYFTNYDGSASGFSWDWASGSGWLWSGSGSGSGIEYSGWSDWFGSGNVSGSGDDFGNSSEYSGWNYSGSGYSDGSGSGWSGYSDGSGSGWSGSGWSGSGFDWSGLAEIDICGFGMDYFEDCMSVAYECDNEDLLDILDDVIDNYKSQFCRGGELRGYIEEFEGVLNDQDFIEGVEEDLGCAGVLALESLFLEGTCDVQLDEYDLDGDLVEFQEIIAAAFRNTFSCIRTELVNEHGCSNMAALKPLIFYLYVDTLIPGIDVDFDDIFEGFDQSSIDPNAQSRSTVAVFGDPHLRVWLSDADRYQTCSAPGEQTYISNNYIVITGFNELASGGWDATFMTAVDIKIYNNGIAENNMLAHYEAGDSELSTNFTDASVDSDVNLEDLGDDVIRISSETAGVSITLARISHTYMLVLRMADSVFRASSGLLYNGCPAADLINRDEEVARRRRKRSVNCGSGEYSAACEYDFAVTGDETLANAVVNTMSDLTANAEALDDELATSSNNNNGGGGGGDSGVNHVHATPAFVVFMVVLTSLKLWA